MKAENTYRVIIAGSRSFDDYDLLRRRCDEILKDRIPSSEIVIVSGTAPGADSLGERYACEKGFAVDRRPADWNTYGKAAGPIRNAEMAQSSDALIAFWDGKSRGTHHMISLAGKKGLDVHVIPI